MNTREEGADQHPNESVPTEVRERTGYQRYPLEYKQRIVAEVIAAQHGGVGVILRREGLYSGTVNAWRAELAPGSIKRKLGRPASSETPLKREIERLRRENQRLERKLEHAGLIIAVQKKVSELLGIPLSEPPESPY
jgi:transposase-like protein